jgi:hypothetical protein
MRAVPAASVLLLALLPGCGKKPRQEDPTAIRPAEVLGTRVDYPNHGFSVVVPPDWVRGEARTFVRLQKKPGPESDPDEYAVTVNIVAEPIPAHIRTTEEYLEMGVEHMRVSFKGFRVLGSAPDTISDTPAIASLFAMVDEGKELKILSYALLAGGRGYVVSCRSGAEDFFLYRELFAGIAKSIRLR